MFTSPSRMCGSPSGGLRLAPRRGGTAMRPIMSWSRSLDGDLLLEEPGGGSRMTTLKRHGSLIQRREGVEHNVVDANPFDYAFMEIEI